MPVGSLLSTSCVQVQWYHLPCPFLTDKPFSEIHGSIKAELIARASHDHAVFGDDSAKVFQLAEEATRSTSVASTLGPFRRTKDGRGAVKAIQDQHAGIDKWEGVIKTSENFLKLHKFKGNSNYTLEKHCDGHRQHFISMQEASEHVSIQLPNERSRVGYLLDSIECQDLYVITQLAQIKSNDPSLRENFEASVTSLIPVDPVVKKKGKNEANKLANISGIDFKKGKGTRTGVDLRFHPNPEYRALTDDQRLELREWRDTEEGKAASAAYRKRKNNGQGPPGKGRKKAKKIETRFRKQVASIVAEEKKKQSDDNTLLAFVEAINASNSGTTATEAKATASSAKAVMQLQTIMKNFRG